MPIQKPTGANTPTTSQGGNTENRQQVSRGNFNNTTVTVAGQDTSANEASQHLPAGELSQPSPIPPPRSRRNVRIASRSASFLPPAGASNMSPRASNIPLSANNPLYEPTSDPSFAASNIPPSDSSEPSQTESVYGPVTVPLPPYTFSPSKGASNIPPTVPLDSSDYEPVEPASPMTLESAGPPRMPLAATSTPPPKSGSVKLPPSGASNVPSGASNIPPTVPLDSSDYELVEPASPMTLESAGPPRMPLAATSTPPPKSGSVKLPPSGASNVPSGASNIPPTVPLDSSDYELVEPASPMTLESAGPPRMPLAATSTPPPKSGSVKLPPSGASNVPSGASNIPPTVPLDSSDYELVEPASPMTLESAGPPRMPLAATSSEYATVSLPDRPEESGMDTRVRQSYTELSRRLKDIGHRFANYTTELTNDIILVDNTVTQPPNPQLSSEEAAAIGRAKATVRNKIHETCIRSMIKELENVRDGFKNIMDQGDASTRQYMTNSNNINSRMNSVELNIEHLQGRLAKLYDTARSLRNYEAHVRGKAESRLDTLPYKLTHGNKMMESISSSVDEIARTVGVINPDFQIPLNTRLSLPSLKTELQAHKDAIAAYKRDILEGDNGVGARVVQAFQAASRGPNEPGSNISSAAGSITSAIYYWTMYSSLIDSMERAESNIGRLLDQIEPLLPSSQ